MGTDTSDAEEIEYSPEEASIATPASDWSAKIGFDNILLGNIMEKHDFGDHNDSKESFFCRFNRLNHDCTPRVRDPVVFRQKYFVSQIIDRSQNNIEDTRHKLSCWPHPARNCQTDRAKWLSWLCYHQVKVEDSDCDDNTFVAPLRSLRFNRILLNVKNAPITFQHRKLENTDWFGKGPTIVW